MNKYYIIIGILVLIIIIGYFTNWFGLKNINKNSTTNSARMLQTYIPLNILKCPDNCFLSTNTSGASGTVTDGNIKYTCRCSDGSTTSPTL